MKKIDYIKIFLSDGKSHKLKDIANFVSKFIPSTPSSEYISIYHALRNHPELFVKTKYGEYILKDSSKEWIKLSPTFIIEEIDKVLRSKSKQTPTTIIQVSGKRLVLQEDTATRTDNNGMSESQSYEYTPNPNGQIFFATLRKDGRWRISKVNENVTLNVRRKYHDYSF